MLYKFTYNGLEFEISVPEGENPADIEHAHLLNVSQEYRLNWWKTFREELTAPPEYPYALAIAYSTPQQSTNLSIFMTALDYCGNGNFDQSSINKFYSAKALYLSGLPETTEGDAIRARVDALVTEFFGG